MSGRRLAGTSTALLCALATMLAGRAAGMTQLAIAGHDSVRVLRIAYRAHDGLLRGGYVILPSWYGPQRHPMIPLIISPHGRGVNAWANVKRWGSLPTVGGFAVVTPEGQGRKLALFSWGDPGEIRDLARMRSIVAHALPWLRTDSHRVYAFGGSMGGQETLLLDAKFPRLLAGAASFDAPTNMAARYQAFDKLKNGDDLQALARLEIGGTPSTDPNGYEIRSPLDWARRIAFSGVPLQIWWSTQDRTVANQAHESGRLYRDIKRLNPGAPVSQYVGIWAHATEMTAHGDLPYALEKFGLMPAHQPNPSKLVPRDDDVDSRPAASTV